MSSLLETVSQLSIVTKINYELALAVEETQMRLSRRLQQGLASHYSRGVLKNL